LREGPPTILAPASACEANVGFAVKSGRTQFAGRHYALAAVRRSVSSFCTFSLCFFRLRLLESLS